MAPPQMVISGTDLLPECSSSGTSSSSSSERRWDNGTLFFYAADTLRTIEENYNNKRHLHRQAN